MTTTDVHKVFSHQTSDIGTLVFQPYIVRLNNVKNAPFNFDHGNDTQLTWRIANFNYTGLAQGKFNIRIGHFEVPFGLEYKEDTNGTLRQFTSSDRGIKADWGVSLNGILPSLVYEISLTRGSGNEIVSKGNPHLFAGRIGTPSDKNFISGISWFVGDILGENGVTQRKKIGLDTAFYYHQWQLMTEVSVGETADNNTLNGFAEVMWKNASENISTYVQIGYQNTDVNGDMLHQKNSTSYWIAGIHWISFNGFDLSAQYKNKIKDLPTKGIDSALSVQLRYRL